MYPNGPRRQSMSSACSARRKARFRLEHLEMRRLLSTTGAGTTVTPAVHLISPAGTIGSAVTNPTPIAGSFQPGQISVAYGFYLRPEDGSGTTIAIIDAYNDPNIRADLAVFNSYYRLPRASLTIENQNGGTDNLPSTDPGWSLEIATDVEWAHADCPFGKNHPG